MIDHLSSSQINLYLQCALKYKYAYIDRLPKPFRPSALVFGGALHSALAWLHQERMKGNGVSTDRLFRIFEADWYSQTVDTDIRYKDGEEEMKLVVMGKEMLGLYFRQPAGKIKGAEVPFIVPLANPVTGEDLGVNLEGFFDLVEVGDTIVEFKTSAQALSPNDIRAQLQLTAYGYAFELLYGRSPRAFKVVNFVKNKKPRIELLDTSRGKSHYETFLLIAEQVLRGIRSEIFFPRPGFWCKDCEYANICPIWTADAAPVTAAQKEKAGIAP